MRPRLTTGLPLSLAHTRMRLPAGTFPVLAMNAPYTESQPHAIPLGGNSPQMDDASVLLCVTLSLMPALLPEGDESAMNFEGLGVTFWTYL